MRTSTPNTLEKLAYLHDATADDWARRAADANRWGLCDEAEHARFQSRQMRIDALLNRAHA